MRQQDSSSGHWGRSRTSRRGARALMDALEDRRMLALVAVDDGGQFVAPHVTTEDVVLEVQANEGLLSNDTTEEGATAQKVLNPQHGTVQVFSNGRYIYTPDANYYGYDSFTYRIVNGGNQSNIATVTVTVDAVNDSPSPQADTYTTGRNQTLTVPTLQGVLANDTDHDITPGNPTGDVLVVSLAFGNPLPAPGAPADPFNLPAHGTVTLNEDGSFVYTPDTDYFGPDSFNYYIYDSLGGISGAAVTITVTEQAAQLPPVALNDDYETNEDTPRVVNAAEGLKDNDSDPNGDTFTLQLLTPPAHGDITNFDEDDGSFTYTPDANFHGTDTFTYRGRDGGNGNIATVTITVNPVNDAPVAPNITVNRAPGQPVNINIFGVATDADGQQLDFALVTPPGNGGVVRAANATPDNLFDDYFIYTPNGTDPLTDTFTYSVTDGTATTVGTVTVNRVDGTVALATNPFNSTRKDLVITGTDANDSIVVVEKADASVNVTLNGVFRGNFKPTGSVIVNAGLGNDTITAAALKRANILYGGSGADTIIGGGRNDIMVGGGGSDRLEGNAGRNILIGGDGADNLIAVALNTIFVSGISSYESPTSISSRRSLEQLMAAWAGSGSFSTRVNKVRNGTGTSNAKLTSATISNDSDTDNMTHVVGPDLFLRSNPDVINGAITSDRVFTI